MIKNLFCDGAFNKEFVILSISLNWDSKQTEIMKVLGQIIYISKYGV